MSRLDQFLDRIRDVHNLNMANAVLNWDQRTYMPTRGVEARAKQLGTLAKLAHDLFVSRETQDLLAAAEGEMAGYPEDSPQRAMVRVARRDMDRATRVPTQLVVRMTETCAVSEEVWQKARADDDYASFAPWLEKVLELKREVVAAIDAGKPIYDVLLDDFEPDMTGALLDPLFTQLKKFTAPLVARIVEHAGRVSDAVLTRDYDEAAQQAFGRKILTACGFPWDRGRLDVSVHPFCTNFSPKDVRITTRYERNWMPGSLFGCMHEMGHAFYELNVDPAYEGTPLGGGVSLGVHESQSRLWENMVGRSVEFWERYYPELQGAFPGQLRDVPLDIFYRAINRVTPSLIRVEADEVTYNLHIILRYEMEQDLLNKRISVKDAPALWKHKMRESVGIEPQTDREGILQDVHWSGGGVGYFPTYTLGNILSAQLFEAATAAVPTIRTDIRAGRFDALYEWLRVNVHQHGRRYQPAELIQRATGKPLSLEPYMNYLKGKFSRVYEL
ncbi:MAG TPA: carboxypeptidase M32 [Phycisphaerae bacterium]|nr:carboxypeptidase M32 [Phycisphaerae bacterium]